MKDEYQMNNKPTIFVSFNSKSSEFVDSLEERISSNAVVVRYEDAISDWGSFRDFMDTINEQRFAVLVISEDYLKSDACMYEVYQLMQDKQWRDKTMFAVMPDAGGIYKFEIRADYIKYWNDKYTDYEERLKGLRPEAITAQLRELERIRQIGDSIGMFLEAVSDAKNPQIYNVISAICQRIELQKVPKLKMPMSNTETATLGQWYVMEFIKKYGAVPVSEITTASGLSSSYVYRMLKDYVAEGLVTSSEQKRKNGLVKVYQPLNDDESA